MSDNKLASLSSELEALQAKLDALRKKGEDGTATHKDLAEAHEISTSLNRLMKEVGGFVDNLVKRH